LSAWGYLGILAPLLAGAAIVHRRGAHPALSLGAGWLLGQLLVVGLMFFALALTGVSHSRIIVVALVIIAVAFSLYRFARESRDPKIAHSVVDARARTAKSSHRSFVGWIAVALLVLSLSAKLWCIVPGVAKVPIRNDDAISMWLFKAKVIAETDHLSFDSDDPFYLGGSNPRYPVYLPLAAAFIPLLEGGWNEAYAAIPWIGFFVALPLAVAGSLYERIRSVAPAALAAYAIASLPLLSIHAYRPGYADLPLAAFLAAAVGFALLSDTGHQRRRQLLLSLVMLIGAALMKREGPVLAAAVALVVVLPRAWPVVRRNKRLASIAFVLVGFAFATIIALMDLRDVGENVRQLQYHDKVFEALARHAFEWASFNLAFWLLPCAVVAMWILPRASGRLTATTLTITLTGIIAAIFVLTPQYRFAMNDQTPSRLFLQILPAMVVACTVPLTYALCPSVAANSPEPVENR